jgi:peptidoglycan/LPS O-acetylase OafA/YrhL
LSRSQRAKGGKKQEPKLSLKKVSLYWVLLVGLLAVAAQGFTYYLRFGHWNTDATSTEYLLFFLAGSLGGGVLIYFVNRQTSATRRWVVLIAFLLASPIALFTMIAGGLLGPPGVLIFPQIPWALFTWIGSWVGKFISRG